MAINTHAVYPPSEFTSAKVFILKTLYALMCFYYIKFALETETETASATVIVTAAQTIKCETQSILIQWH